ncbi:hypothetical protein EI94DRAFT_1723751 [Lactarius quietus]|nr:hypothetical protein EI94DRAFT_1723751 [Lactarius quietus]
MMRWPAHFLAHSFAAAYSCLSAVACMLPVFTIQQYALCMSSTFFLGCQLPLFSPPLYAILAAPIR